jgi:hypothetical protein
MSKLFLPGSPEWEETLAQVKTRDLPLSFPFATIPTHCHSTHLNPAQPRSRLGCFHCSAPG